MRAAVGVQGKKRTPEAHPCWLKVKGCQAGRHRWWLQVRRKRSALPTHWDCMGAWHWLGAAPAGQPVTGDSAGYSFAGWLLRAGERVGLAGDDTPPRPGRAQIVKLAAVLSGAEEAGEYGAPTSTGMVSHGRALFLSDFLGDLAPVEATLTAAADRGVRGALVQVLDPAEEEFPFSGRTVFESMGGGLRHETQQAGDLRDRYLARLAERKDRLTQLGRAVGWHVTTHHTGQPAQSALLWIYSALQGGR